MSYNQRQNNPYSNTYNSGLKGHPNFSYRNNQEQGSSTGARPSYQSGQQSYQQQQPTQGYQLSKLEKMLKEVISGQHELKQEIKMLNQRMDSSEKYQKMQDSQIAQIASSSSRALGHFPGKPDVNPMEHCNRIKLRSGRTLGDPQIQDDEENIKKAEETFPLYPQSQAIPCPQRLVMMKKDEEFGRFLDKVKDICVEVPLIDVIQQMLKFAKFLKDIMSNKKRKGDIETIALTEECSALFEKNTSPKLQDLGSFYIP
ncbi:uncharacterized protein LOC121994954 [Zingiber officinale]|uniref:uncharacterized protein LOC121994954 n=1 Tax=Zingiber officinale TaxID=94328 RepID=UPI001C4B8E5C|nr:uncharacterized protein LOC121994954 [Zingiber officinale]